MSHSHLDLRKLTPHSELISTYGGAPGQPPARSYPPARLISTYLIRAITLLARLSALMFGYRGKIGLKIIKRPWRFGENVTELSMIPYICINHKAGTIFAKFRIHGQGRSQGGFRRFS